MALFRGKNTPFVLKRSVMASIELAFHQLPLEFIIRRITLTYRP